MPLEIPYKKLSQEELDNYCAIMRKGNKLLRSCAEKAGMEYRKFRIRVFKKPFDPDDYPELPAAVVWEIKCAMPAIQAVRSIEWDMVCAFSRLVQKRVLKWRGGGPRNSGIIGYEDFVQEGYMALIDSIYNFTRGNVRFITFAQWSIDRRLITALNRNNPFCPLTNQSIQLKKRYEKAVRQTNGPVNQEQVITGLQVSEDEAQIIRRLLIPVIHPSQHRGDNDRGQIDYSEDRLGIDRERCETIPGEYHFRNFDGSVPLAHELRAAIKEAGLSTLELKVLETFMSPHYGWQEELASKTTNPRTQKRYTRQAINVILQSAVKKVKAVYLSERVA